jgi:hypothetical protein
MEVEGLVYSEVVVLSLEPAGRFLEELMTGPDKFRGIESSKGLNRARARARSLCQIEKVNKNLKKQARTRKFLARIL